MLHGNTMKQEDLVDDADDLADDDVNHDSASGPPSPNAADGATSNDKPNGPMQKRRRVTRACDECRRKKIKCDGKQPCTHCTVYSYDCSYDQPSNRRRNPVPAYVEALEARVHLAEGLIRMSAPNRALNDPALEIAVRHGYIPGLKPGVQAQPVPPSGGPVQPQRPQEQVEIKQEADLESMIRAIGQIELDENGQWDYHGHSSGLSFIRRMREQLGDLMGPDIGSSPFIKSRKVSQVIDSPRSAASPIDPVSPSSDLPPESLARQLCEHAVGRQSTLLIVVHVPSFWKSFKRIYSVPSEQYTVEDNNFIALLYSAMALGIVYGPPDNSGYDHAIERGFKYFRTARMMMDIADIRHLTLIQALTYMVMFLQTSAKLSQCYGYIGVAMRAATRMGLHRGLPPTSFRNPLESEMRKRVFWTLRKLDVYTGTILGLPRSLGDDEIDQDYPEEVDDEYLTEAGILSMPPGAVSKLTAFNLHTRLVHILVKIVKTVYPIRPGNGSLTKSYTVPFSKIREIEQDLETWKANLPSIFDPSQKDPNFSRAAQALRLTYSFNQVLLYRPFLHFVEADKKAKQTDQRAYACAASYIHVSRNLIHLCEARHKEGSLIGSLWFIMYTTFFSILSLVYFAAENPDNPTTQDLMKDALSGKKILSDLAKQNMSADRCTATLDAIFSRLPDWMREGKPNPVPKRKRKHVPDARNLVQVSQAPSGSRLGASLAPVEISRGTSPLNPGAGPFTPQAAGFGSAPFTPTDYSPTTQTLQQFGLSGSNADMSDLSNMIFPAADSFSYPSQPLTTFENNINFKDPSVYSMPGTTSAPSMPQVGSSGRQGSDALEAQLYGLPPFMLQSNQWQGDSSGMHAGTAGPSRPIPGQQFMVNQQGMKGMAQNWQAQQQQQQQPMYQNQGYNDINLNDIFGGIDWPQGSLMNQNQGGFGM